MYTTLTGFTGSTGDVQEHAGVCLLLTLWRVVLAANNINPTLAASLKQW